MIDTTSAKTYAGVSEAGLFRLGHSKDHRPDWPQVKISFSALNPLSLPLTTTVVSGNCADEARGQVLPFAFVEVIVFA